MLLRVSVSISFFSRGGVSMTMQRTEKQAFEPTNEICRASQNDQDGIE